MNLVKISSEPVKSGQQDDELFCVSQSRALDALLRLLLKSHEGFTNLTAFVRLKSINGR